MAKIPVDAVAAERAERLRNALERLTDACESALHWRGLDKRGGVQQLALAVARGEANSEVEAPEGQARVADFLDNGEWVELADAIENAREAIQDDDLEIWRPRAAAAARAQQAVVQLDMALAEGAVLHG